MITKSSPPSPDALPFLSELRLQACLLACLLAVEPVPPLWGILPSRSSSRPANCVPGSRSLTSPLLNSATPSPKCGRATRREKQDIARQRTKGTQIAIRSSGALAACGCLPACLSPEARRLGVQTKGWSRDILLALRAAFNYLSRPPALDARHLLALPLLPQPSL
jgi:hypothetical protein